jgi:hypothetical protein
MLYVEPKTRMYLHCVRWRYLQEAADIADSMNSVAFSPQSNYTDWAITTGRWILGRQ